MCEKLSFETFRDAEHVINAANAIGRTQNRHMSSKKPKRAYRCPDCGKIHLTSKKKVDKTRKYK